MPTGILNPQLRSKGICLQSILAHYTYNYSSKEFHLEIFKDEIKKFNNFIPLNMQFLKSTNCFIKCNFILLLCHYMGLPFSQGSLDYNEWLVKVLDSKQLDKPATLTLSAQKKKPVQNFIWTGSFFIHSSVLRPALVCQTLHICRYKYASYNTQQNWIPELEAGAKVNFYWGRLWTYSSRWRQSHFLTAQQWSLQYSTQHNPMNSIQKCQGFIWPNMQGQNCSRYSNRKVEGIL